MQCGHSKHEWECATKTFLKIIVGLVAFIGIVLGAVFYMTAGMVDSADGFFAAVKDKDMDKAYSFLSEDFKAATSQAKLEKFLKQNAIDQFKASSWSSRSSEGGRGELVGSISTDSGGTIPITVNLVKGEDGWKIFAINKPNSGLQEESKTAVNNVPSEAELVALTNQSMAAFAQAVNEKSMLSFHKQISQLWQQQYTVAQLDEAFGSFYDAGVDLTLLKGYSPQFAEIPSINSDGVLRVSGHYPTDPNQVHYEHKYIFEGMSWKLLGFSTELQ